MRGAILLAALVTVLAAALLFIKSVLLVLLLVAAALVTVLHLSSETESPRWLYTLYTTSDDASFDAGVLTLPSVGAFEWTDRPFHLSRPLSTSVAVDDLRKLISTGVPNATVRLGTAHPFVAEVTAVQTAPLRLTLRALPSQSLPASSAGQSATVVVDSGTSSIGSVACSAMDKGDFSICDAYCPQTPRPQVCQKYCYTARKEWVGLDTLDKWRAQCGSSFSIPDGDMIPDVSLRYSACMEAIRVQCDQYT